MNFYRAWAMPSKHTFTIKPISELLDRYTGEGQWMDPFAGLHSPACVTNDLNPECPTTHHLDAEEFCLSLADHSFDGVLFDPPYSPRQIAECYKGIGLSVGMKETQNAALYARVRNAAVPKLRSGGLAINFGWNSSGFGVTRGFEIEEILLVCHGAAHNDTIVTVERKIND